MFGDTSDGEKRRNRDKSAALWISEKNEGADTPKTASTDGNEKSQHEERRQVSLAAL